MVLCCTVFFWNQNPRISRPSCIFNLETTSYPEDNPIHGIDPELFAERATHTSARTETSTNAGYQAQQYWSSSTKGNQSSIRYSEPTTNPENSPTFGVDHTPPTERTTHPSTNVGPHSHSGFQLQDTQNTQQSGSWPTTSITNANQPSKTR